MTKPLTLKLFGGLVIEKGGEPVTGLVTLKAEVLLAYLACHPRPHSRELLATMLWDGRSQKQALSNLRTLLTSLRRHLRPYLAVTRKSMALDWEQPIWVDAVAFEEAVGELMEAMTGEEAAADDPAALEEALALYTADFLEGIFVDESRGVEEWAAGTRERLRQMATWARERLALHYLHHRRYAAGARHARELVRLDPLREGTHRLLMRLLARDGRRNAALAQYEACRRILLEELGVEPAAETTALHRRIARARAQPPHRLPEPPTPFVGRAAELAAISRRLDDDDCRLLTLVGPGGAGKTRLALEAAGHRRGDYLDGVFFVNLAPVSEARNVPLTIAGALDLPPLEKQPPRAQLLNHLQEREMLLLLDNFEHLLEPDDKETEDTVGLVCAILKTAPDVKLLVTSRHRLRLRAEWALTVGGLQTGDGDAPGEAHRPRDDAAQLFTACARRVLAGFDPAGDSATVARICRLVEGLPLAIELAAASLPQHSPEEIAAAIRRNLDYLSSSMRDAPARHRSLRAVFDHSWALLGDAEREAFRRLAVFHSTFGREAAREVTGAASHTLGSLVAKSLLRRDEAGRYDLHPVLHHYALEKLAGAGAAAAGAERTETESATRDRHSAHYLHFVQERKGEFVGPRAGAAQQEIVAVLDDVRAAWEWAARRHRWPALARSLDAFASFYSLSGLAREGQRAVQAALDEALAAIEKGAGDQSEKNMEAAILASQLLVAKARLLVEQGQNEPAVGAVERALALPASQETRIAAHFQAGRALWRASRFEEAEERLQQALALCADGVLPTPHIRGDILRTLGITAMHLGDYRRAEEFYGRALRADEASGSRRGEAVALNQFGRIAELRGDFRQAQQYYERALPHFRESGFRRGEIAAQINLGNTLRTLGQYATARDHLRQSLSLARETNDRYQEGLALYNLSILHHLLGDLQAAQEVGEEALTLTRRAEYRQGEGNSTYALSQVALDRGDRERAEHLARQALAIYREIESPYGEAGAFTLLGRIALRNGRLQEAESHFEEALAIGRDVHSQHVIADATAYRSLYLARSGETEAALAQAQEAVALAQKTGVQRLIGDALTILGHVHAAGGDTEAAAETYRQALTLRRETGQRHLTPEPLAGLARLALEAGDLDEALTHVEAILAYLADHPLHGPEQPERILDACRCVLAAAGDPRAQQLNLAPSGAPPNP